MCIVVHKLSMSNIWNTISDTCIVNHISWASCLTEPPQWGLNGLSNNHLLWLPRPNCIRMLLFLWYSIVHGGSNRIHSANGLQTTMPRLMPSSHFYSQSYGLLRFGHTWGVMVNRGRDCRVYLVMRNLSWANVSERIGSGRLKRFLNMFKNKKWIVVEP